MHRRRRRWVAALLTGAFVLQIPGFEAYQALAANTNNNYRKVAAKTSLRTPALRLSHTSGPATGIGSARKTVIFQTPGAGAGAPTSAPGGRQKLNISESTPNAPERHAADRRADQPAAAAAGPAANADPAADPAAEPAADSNADPNADPNAGANFGHKKKSQLIERLARLSRPFGFIQLITGSPDAARKRLEAPKGAAEDVSRGADRTFQWLHGQADGAVVVGLPAAPTDGPALFGALPAGSPAAGLVPASASSRGRYAAAAGAGAAVAALPAIAQAKSYGIQTSPDESLLSSVLGWGSYWSGNFLTTIFALPESYDYFRTGAVKDVGQKWPFIGGMIIGLVLAPMLGLWVWGLQNLFGNAALFLPKTLKALNQRYPAGMKRVGLGQETRPYEPLKVAPGTSWYSRWQQKAKDRLKNDHALRKTGLAAIPLLALSLGLYMGMEAVIDSLGLSKETQSWIFLIGQVSAQSLIFTLFLSDGRRAVEFLWAKAGQWADAARGRLGRLYDRLLGRAPRAYALRDASYVWKERPSNGYNGAVAVVYGIAMVFFTIWPLHDAAILMNVDFFGLVKAVFTDWNLITRDAFTNLFYAGMSVAMLFITGFSTYFNYKQKAYLAGPGQSAPPAPPSRTDAPNAQAPPTSAPPLEAGPPSGEGPPRPAGETQAKAPTSNQSPAAAKAEPGPGVYEGGVLGFLGFRSYRGIVHKKGIKALKDSASSLEIVNQIMDQFAISREQMLDMARRHQVPLEDNRSFWLAVYDDLQQDNLREFINFDQKKYHGSFVGEAWSRVMVSFGLSDKVHEGSFRKLTNKTYKAGWAGVGQRLLEQPVKAPVGFVFRFPYHLFDMFILGYYRRNLAFGLRHSHEDFLNHAQKGSALKALERAVARNAGQKAGGLRSTALGRKLHRWFGFYLAGPTIQFLARRVPLITASTVSMALMAPFALVPALQLSLVSVPALGPAIVWMSHAVPAAAGSLSPGSAGIAAATIQAFVDDLTIFRLLQTGLLSTFMTLPRAHHQRLMDGRRGELDVPSFWHGEYWSALVRKGGTLRSASFWKQNSESFFGLITVGAEIEGVMSYMGRLDAALDRAVYGVTGHHLDFSAAVKTDGPEAPAPPPSQGGAPPPAAPEHAVVGVFTMLGAAIERDKHHSPLNLPGAITWGNEIMYHLQGVLGFNVTDAIFAAWNPVVRAFLPDQYAVDAGPIRAPPEVSKAAAAVQQASMLGGGSAAAQLVSYKPGPPGEVKEKAEAAIAAAGNFSADLDRIRQRLGALKAQLAESEKRLADYERQDKPLTESELKEFESMRKRVQEIADEEAVEGKLGAGFDSRSGSDSRGPGRVERLKELTAMQERLGRILRERGELPGKAESSSLQVAVEKGVEAAIQRVLDAAPKEEKEMRGKVVEELEKRVKSLEAHRDAYREGMERRNRHGSILAAQAEARNAALKERRNSQYVMKMFEDKARVRSSMDLAYLLKVIGAVQEGIQQGLNDLDLKEQKIRGNTGAIQNGLATANNGINNISVWKTENQQTIDQDKKDLADVQEAAGQAARALKEIPGFNTRVSSVKAVIESRDRQGGLSALEVAKRNEQRLPEVQKWKLEGRPDHPDYRNVKTTRDVDLADVRKHLADLVKGQKDIGEAPSTFFGPIIFGFKVDGEPPLPKQPQSTHLRTILEYRAQHWDKEVARFQKKLDDVNNMLSTTYDGEEEDEFGNWHKTSLPLWRADEVKEMEDARTGSGGGRNPPGFPGLNSLVPALNEYVQRVNAASIGGVKLAALNANDLEDLKSKLENYSDQISKVEFDSNDKSDRVFQAKMDLLALASLLPEIGYQTIRWAKADATITEIDKALSGILPKAQAGLQKAYDTIVAFRNENAYHLTVINTSLGDRAVAQQVWTRARDLINVSITRLTGVEKMLVEDLIPYLSDVSAYYTLAQGGTKFAKLFDSQIKLYEGVEKALNKTFPEAIASKGASTGGGQAAFVAAAMKNIQTWREKYEDLRNGKDENGQHSKGLLEIEREMRARLDPNFAGYGAQGKLPALPKDETLYGEVQPFSLPQKISQYGAEKTRRIAEYNQQAKEVNQILSEIDQLAHTNLSAHRLPENLTGSQADMDRLRGMKNEFEFLGDELTRIGNQYKELGTDGTDGEPESERPPVGQQPTSGISTEKRIALIALEAGKRLVPSTNQPPATAPATYAAARAVYSHNVVKEANEAMTNKVPQVLAMVGKGMAATDNALAELKKDEAYVQAPEGQRESRQSLIDRTTKNYAQLHEFTLEAVRIFQLKITWDEDAFKTIDDVNTYYDALKAIYDRATDVQAKELEAVDRIRSVLRKEYDKLEESRVKYLGWFKMLNHEGESSMKASVNTIDRIMEQTERVARTNKAWMNSKEEFDHATNIVKATVIRMQDEQAELRELLEKEVPDPRLLPKKLLERIKKLSAGGPTWAINDEKGNPQALVIKKTAFQGFIDQFFGGVVSQFNSGRDLTAMKDEILRNPYGLTNVIPDSKMIEFGEGPDGFYLVYDSRFSVPNGMGTSNRALFGNVFQIAGTNVSFGGYQFHMPNGPNSPPYGEKGLHVQFETLGKDITNYLMINLGKSIGDIAPDDTVASTLKETRMMIFEDFAVVLMGDKLYFGLAGYTDFALNRPLDNPSMYAGVAKMKYKFNEFLTLNAKEQAMFLADPRQYMKTLDFDYTGLDSDLQRRLNIFVGGSKYSYNRFEAGPKIDLGKLLKQKEDFQVDFFVARQKGSWDVDQDSGGISVLKGFSFYKEDGKPWLRIHNQATGEAGEKMNVVANKATFELPDYGAAFSAQGRFVGSAGQYYLEARKAMSGNTSMGLGWGSQYLGYPNRLYLNLNTNFNLADIWAVVKDNAAEGLAGGKYLKNPHQEMDKLLTAGAADSKAVGEIKDMLYNDIGRKLRTQQIGKLTDDLKKLRSSGLLENTRVTGRMGLISNPISNAKPDRVTGGSFAAGTNIETAFNKTQVAQIREVIPNLFLKVLETWAYLLGQVKEREAAIIELIEAEREMTRAQLAINEKLPDAIKAQASAALQQAASRFNEAKLNYNLIVGRPSDAPSPFDGGRTQDVLEAVAQMRRELADPRKISTVLKHMNPEGLKGKSTDDDPKVDEENPFNLVDYIPLVENMTFFFGVNFNDMLANQLLGMGLKMQIPLYNPSKDNFDAASELLGEAAMKQMEQIYRDFALKAERERQEARFWQAEAETMLPEAKRAFERLKLSMPLARNGDIPEADLTRDFAEWNWRDGAALHAASKASLHQAWSIFDSSIDKWKGSNQPFRLSSIESGLKLAVSDSPSMAEHVKRLEAARQMTDANDRRIHKLSLDLTMGTNLTAWGFALIPAIEITGVAALALLRIHFNPSELQELQTLQGQAVSESVRLKMEVLRAQMAADLYKNIATAQGAEKAARLVEANIIPRLRSAHERARGGDPSEELQAKASLDNAAFKANQLHLAASQARATINYMLGRAPDAPLELDVDLNEAAKDIRLILGQAKPVQSYRRILDNELSAAKAKEEIELKGLGMQAIQMEPVSILVRTLGRLAAALADAGVQNPEKVMRAVVERLSAQRQIELYERQVDRRRYQVDSERRSLMDRINDLAGRSEPESQVEAAELRQRLAILEVEWLSLEGDARLVPEKDAQLPSTFDGLSEMVESAFGRITGMSREFDSFVLEKDRPFNRSMAHMRWFWGNMDVGRHRADPRRGPNQALPGHFLEGWVELRLRSESTPADVLTNLAQQKYAKEERITRNELVRAHTKARVMMDNFREGIAAYRRAEGAEKERLRARLEGDAQEIKALVHLPASTTFEQIERLVPFDKEGSRSDVRRSAERLLGRLDKADLALTNKLILEGKVPNAVLEREDALANQLRADVIADKFSYKGFTPVVAAAWLRNHPVFGGYLEAPDPREVMGSLSRIVPESLKQQLEAEGRANDFKLHMDLLDARVRDYRVLVERQYLYYRAAAEAYRSAAVQYEKGDLQLTDVESAKEQMLKAWSDFTDAVTELSNVFTEFVTELEALGLADEDKYESASPLALPSNWDEFREVDSTAILMSQWSKRFLDPDFAARQDAVFADNAIDPVLRKKILDAAGLYREMVEKARRIRNSGDEPARKLQLLAEADPEGKRAAVESLIGQVLLGLEKLNAKDNPVYRNLLKFVQEDAAEQVKQAKLRAEGEAKLAQDMREAIWRSADPSPALEGAFLRLEKLYAEKAEAKQDLMDHYLSNAEQTKHFVAKDAALDRYLKSEEAFDRELIHVLDASEVRADTGLNLVLDGLYDIRGSLERRIDAARKGRGIAAINALIAVQEARLAALRYENAPPSERTAVAAEIDRLTKLKEKWPDSAAGNASYAALAVDDSGRRIWSDSQWLSQAQLDKYKEEGLLRSDDAGRLWLRDPDTGREREVVAGMDAADRQRARAEEKVDQNERTRKVFEVLRTNHFALTTLDGTTGRTLKGIAFEEFEELSRKGQVYYFSKSADKKSSTKPARHPLKGLELPHETDIIVYIGNERPADDPAKDPVFDQVPGRAMFPTREAFDDYISQLKASKDPREREKAGLFVRLEAGETGIKLLSEKAKQDLVRSQRSGWLLLKLKPYGFAFGREGAVGVYGTKEEYRKVREKLERAEQNLVDAKAAHAEAEKAHKEYRATTYKDAAEKLANAQRDYAQYEETLKKDLTAKVFEELELPAETKLDDVQRIQFNEALTRRMNDDSKYEKLKKAASAASESYTAVSRKEKELDRIKVEAGRAEKESTVWLERAKHWRLFLAEDIELLLDQRGRLTGVSVKPEFHGPGSSPAPMTQSWEEPEGSVHGVSGAVAGIVPDRMMNPAKIYKSESEMKDDAANWPLQEVYLDQRVAKALSIGEDAAGRVPGAPMWRTHDPYGKQIDPNYRLKQYIVPKLETASGEIVVNAPVLLNSRLTSDLISSAETRLFFRKYEHFMPWYWPDWALEFPRGVTQAIIEPITGRDPNHQGFLGKIHMNKGEGGAMADQNVVLKILRKIIDPMQVMPEETQMYYDLGDLPMYVRLSSWIVPGQDILSKTVTSLDGEQAVYFGRKAIERRLAEHREDLAAQSETAMSYLEEGGTDVTLEVTRAGRDRDYRIAQVYQRSAAGDRAGAQLKGDPSAKTHLDAVLADPVIGGHQDSAGESPIAQRMSGRLPSRYGIPLASDFQNSGIKDVVKQTKVIPGAKHYERVRKAWDGLAGQQRARSQNAINDAETIAAERLAAQRTFDASLSRRNELERRRDASLNRYQTISWRVGEQRAVERRINEAREVIARLKKEIAGLEEELRRRPAPPPPGTHPPGTDPGAPPGTDPPTDPGQPPTQPPAQHPWWWWIFPAIFAAGVVLLLRLLFGRH